MEYRICPIRTSVNKKDEYKMKQNIDPRDLTEATEDPKAIEFLKNNKSIAAKIAKRGNR